jgi:hypothetical protein
MYCPLEEIELKTDTCPAKCIYRKSSGKCAHNELAFNEELNIDAIAEILEIEVEIVKEEARKGMKRVQAALAADAYIAYACRGSVNSSKEDKHPIFNLFNFHSSKLRTVLNEDRYEKWKEISKVDIPFEDIEALFKNVLHKGA